VKLAVTFSLAVRHSYYADAVCPDFVLEPTADTERLLKNYRSVLKPSKNGFSAVTELNDDGMPVIAVDTSSKLRFNLRLKNSDFSLFTDVSAINTEAALLYVTGGSDISNGGSLTLSTQPAPLENGVFAVAEIPGLVLTRAVNWPAQFAINFQPKRARWVYYCVTDLKLTGKNLQLVDIGAQGAPPLTFSPSNRTDLAQFPDAADALGAQLANQYPSLARMRFVSDDAVPCQQSPKRLSLQLDGHNFPDVLPTPPLRNCAVWPFAAQGNQPQQDALFQVVKYVSYSFSKNGA
jgi:hypothetical protein